MVELFANQVTALPITEASAKRSILKLKIIKHYFQSQIFQIRLVSPTIEKDV